MKNRKTDKTITSYLWFAFGLLAVMVEILIMIYLGTSAVVEVRDQLDGEIVAYYLRGRHLFNGNFYPEIMGGLKGASIIAPAPILAVFYAFGDVYTGYLLSFIVVKITAYLSMYFLLNKYLKAPSYISAGVAVTFAYIPFFAVYGLCGPGIPMVLIAFLELAKDHKKLWPYVLLIIYGAASSPVLTGYAVIILLGIVIIFRLIKKKQIKGLVTGAAVLISTYCLYNIDLIKDLISGEVSHKSQMVYFGSSFVESFVNVLFKGIVMTPSYHQYCFWISLVTLIISGCYAIFVKNDKRKTENKNLKNHTIILATLMVLGIMIALYNSFFVSDFVANLRNHMGTLGSFQSNRFYWLYPALWYLSLGVSACIINDFRQIIIEKNEKVKLITNIASVVIILGIIGICAANILYVGTFRYNLRQVIKGNKGNSLTFEDYVDKDEYDAIKAFIEKEEGLSVEEYRVGSLGIEPAVAILNGFYTIDGYSNNYPLKYKEEFRRIIAKELDKNINNVWYYDYWGNRCYLLAAQFNGNQFLGREDHVVYKDLEFDTAAMKALGCDYLLSVGEISGAEEKGYTLLNRFDDARYSYCIYLYKVN